MPRRFVFGRKRGDKQQLSPRPPLRGPFRDLAGDVGWMPCAGFESRSNARYKVSRPAAGGEEQAAEDGRRVIWKPVLLKLLAGTGLMP